MVRVQVRLTTEQAQFVKSLAAERGVSAAAVVRDAVDALARSPWRRDPEAVRQRALAAIGAVRGGPSDMSEKHDCYAAEAFDPAQ